MAEIEIHHERPGSILTPSQREQLSEVGDGLSDAAERMARGRIRKRIGAGVIDLSTILREFPDEDLDKSFTQKFAVAGEALDPKQNIADALGVLYLGSVARPETHGVRGLESVTTEAAVFNTPLIRAGAFANMAESGIKQALTRRGVDVNDVSVSIDLDIEGEFDVGDDRDLSVLPVSRLEQLVLADEITEDEFRRAVEQRLDIDLGAGGSG